MSETSEADRQRATSPAGRASGPWVPWHPPAPLFGVALFTVLTFGFYLPFWALRVAEDLETHADPAVRPWRPAAASLVPGVGWLAVSLLTRRIATIVAGGLVRPKTNPAAFGALAFLAVAGWHGGLAFLVAFWGLGDESLFALAGAVGFLALVLTLIQHRLNLYKESLDGALWIGASYSLSRGEATVLALIAVAWIYAVFENQGSIKRELALARGQPLSAGQEIEGNSGLYTLTLPSSGWVRVGPDDIHEGTDLSLYGAGGDAYLLVYVRCDRTSIDSRVEFRREKQREALRELTIAEERHLEGASLLPVSYALYAGRKRRSGDPKRSIVATVAKDDFLVEVIASSGARDADRAALEAMVKSLHIDEEATSCAS